MRVILYGPIKDEGGDAMVAITNLPWRGAETIEAVRDMLARHDDVELTLPAGYHHAVLAHFRAHTPGDVAERVDVAGGPELLSELAAIRGLDGLAALATAVARAHARVRVMSPSPAIVIHARHEARG